MCSHAPLCQGAASNSVEEQSSELRSDVFRQQRKSKCFVGWLWVFLQGGLVVTIVTMTYNVMRFSWIALTNTLKESFSWRQKYF